MLMPKWESAVAVDIMSSEVKSWLLSLDVSDCTRGKYRAKMSQVYMWAKTEELIPQVIPAKDGGFLDSDPCTRVKGPGFSQESDYEALALEVEDTFALLSQLKQPEYELSLLVAICGLRISEALGLLWRHILWNRAMIAIRQSYVHSHLQPGAKTKLSRSRVEVPQLALDVLAEWRRERPYAGDDDFVFPSLKLRGRKPRTASMIVRTTCDPLQSGRESW